MSARPVAVVMAMSLSMSMSMSMSSCPSLAVPGARAAPDPTPSASASASPVSGPPSTLTARPLGSTAARSGFFERLPPGYGAGKRWPLLVFLHGVGENGDGQSQLPRVLAHGPLRAVRDAALENSTSAGAEASPPARRDPHTPPSPADAFVILSPQHRPAPVAPAVGFDCPDAEEIHAFLTFAIAHYDVDPGRVYLTGLSCGAIGGWRYLGAHLGEQVAAAVLVAGDGREAWRSRGCQLARAVAIWGLHGDADPVVPPAGTIEPMTHLMACRAASAAPGASPREQRLTVYPGVGHDSWTRTYALGAPLRDDIYAWLLRFSR